MRLFSASPHSMSDYITPDFTISSFFSQPYVAGRSLADLLVFGLLRAVLGFLSVLLCSLCYKSKKELWGEMTYPKKNLSKEEKEEASLEEVRLGAGTSIRKVSKLTSLFVALGPIPLADLSQAGRALLSSLRVVSIPRLRQVHEQAPRGRGGGGQRGPVLGCRGRYVCAEYH